jgi:recombination protein RecT
MSETALQKTPDKTLRAQLSGDYFKSQVALALPKHMTADRFARVALTALLKNPKLADCTPESVMECMLNCSALGLEPDGRRAHLIPYGNKCTLIVDYKGIVELAKRSGDVSNVFAQIVCDNDSFTWENGEVKHQIDFRRDRGEMYAVYAQITFKDGTKQVDVMTKHEVDAIRKRSKSSGSGPWVTDYNEMSKKTVFRRASKWVTLSPEVADALDKEDDFIDVKGHVSVAPPVFVSPAEKDAPKKIAASATPPTPAAKTPQMAKFNTPELQTTSPTPATAHGNAIPVETVAKPETTDASELGPVSEAAPEADKSFEDVVDTVAESPELIAMRAAMVKHEVTDAMIINFASQRALFKPEVHGKPAEELKLTDLMESKIPTFTKNILAAGQMLKTIKAAQPPKDRLETVGLDASEGVSAAPPRVSNTTSDELRHSND